MAQSQQGKTFIRILLVPFFFLFFNANAVFFLMHRSGRTHLNVKFLLQIKMG